jgi:hypothetical protein
MQTSRSCPSMNERSRGYMTYPRPLVRPHPLARDGRCPRPMISPKDASMTTLPRPVPTGNGRFSARFAPSWPGAEGAAR